MANPTTNFGWVMPTATDLVTDLPADFAVFGQGVDTSMADLLGGTTGQILSKTSGTDMDFTWIANDQGDITNIGVTSPITGGGSSGSVTIGINDATTSVKGSVQLSDSTSTTSSVLAATPTAVKSAYDLANGAIPKTLTTTTGDVIYASAANTPARLGIGSTSQVLTVTGGLPVWATPASGGSMTALSGSPFTLSGATTTISSISGSYKNLLIYIKDCAASATAQFKLNINGDTTAANYQQLVMRVSGSTNNTYADNATAYLSLSGYDTNASQADNFGWVFIPDYANTTTTKMIQTSMGFVRDTLAVASCTNFTWYKGSTNAITSLSFGVNAGTWNAGTIEIYGVN